MQQITQYMGSKFCWCDNLPIKNTQNNKNDYLSNL